MNKRSFLKNLLILGVAPSLLLSSSTDRFKWKRGIENIWIPNPAWKTAPYRIDFLMGDYSLYYTQFYKDYIKYTAEPRRYIFEHRVTGNEILV